MQLIHLPTIEQSLEVNPKGHIHVPFNGLHAAQFLQGKEFADVKGMVKIIAIIEYMFCKDLCMIEEHEIKVIKNRKRISLGGHPQRVVEKKDSTLMNYDIVAPAAESALASPKPEWDPRPIIHVEKSKTNLTPISKCSLPVTPRFVKGVQNQLRGLDLNQEEFREPKKDYKKMYYAELENTRALKKEVEKLKRRIEDLVALTPEHLSLMP